MTNPEQARPQLTREQVRGRSTLADMLMGQLFMNGQPVGTIDPRSMFRMDCPTGRNSNNSTTEHRAAMIDAVAKQLGLPPHLTGGPATEKKDEPEPEPWKLQIHPLDHLTGKWVKAIKRLEALMNQLSNNRQVLCRVFNQHQFGEHLHDQSSPRDCNRVSLQFATALCQEGMDVSVPKTRGDNAIVVVKYETSFGIIKEDDFRLEICLTHEPSESKLSMAADFMAEWDKATLSVQEHLNQLYSERSRLKDYHALETTMIETINFWRERIKELRPKDHKAMTPLAERAFQIIEMFDGFDEICEEDFNEIK